jgi:hypothetical protein
MTLEDGVQAEIRALRVVMARLLVEEEDLAKLVTGLTRLTAAIVQAARLQRLIDGDRSDPFDEAMSRAREDWGPRLVVANGRIRQE